MMENVVTVRLFKYLKTLNFAKRTVPKMQVITKKKKKSLEESTGIAVDHFALLIYLFIYFSKKYNI